jgi:hypothetical protein
VPEDRTIEVRPEPSLDGFGVEWADSRRLIISRRGTLFERQRDGSRRKLGEWPVPAWRRAVTVARPMQRALRHMYYNVMPLSNGEIFATFGKAIGVFEEGGRFRALTGIERPFRVLRAACAVADDGAVVFGEYVVNHERTAIRIYRYEPGRPGAEVAHTFPAGEVRHVHGVYRDPFAPGLWCAVGDKPAECRILHSDDQFRAHTVFGAGDETWRAVSLQFTPDAVFYGMDAEFQRNFIFRVDRRTGQRDVVTAVEGPIYYSARLGNDLFFAVTVEYCPSQEGNAAVLWRVNSVNGAATRVTQFRKDSLPVHGFLAGTIDFARGDGTARELYLRTTALRPDNAVYSLRR